MCYHFPNSSSLFQGSRMLSLGSILWSVRLGLGYWFWFCAPHYPTTTSNTSPAGSHLVRFYTFFFPLSHLVFVFPASQRKVSISNIKKKKKKIKKASCCYLICNINEKTDVLLKYNFMTSKPGWEAETSVRRYIRSLYFLQSWKGIFTWIILTYEI